MSKYKTRAEEILKSNIPLATIDDVGIIEYKRLYEQYESVLNAMCQLAEEVEKELKLDLYTESDIEEIQIENQVERLQMYSKDQVEELLLKQRILCASNAEAYIEEYSGGDESAYIDMDSILNAKIKLK